MTPARLFYAAATIWLLLALVSAASGDALFAACWLGGAVLWVVLGRVVARNP